MERETGNYMKKNDAEVLGSVMDPMKTPEIEGNVEEGDLEENSNGNESINSALYTTSKHLLVI